MSIDWEDGIAAVEEFRAGGTKFTRLEVGEASSGADGGIEDITIDVAGSC